jgi:hypothetical protein
MKAKEEFLIWSNLHPKLAQLKKSLDCNEIKTVRSQVKDLVPGYVPHEEIIDLLYMAKMR